MRFNKNSNWIDLFILRHGIAEERSLVFNDKNRSLTNEGHIKTTRVVRKLKSLGFKANQIFTSPYKRALETAEIAFKEGLGNKIEITQALEPLGDPFPLLKELSNKNLFIGHEPKLSYLVAKLIRAEKKSLYFKKAGFAHIRWPKDAINPRKTAELVCLIKPSLLK